MAICQDTKVEFPQAEQLERYEKKERALEKSEAEEMQELRDATASYFWTMSEYAQVRGYKAMILENSFLWRIA